MTTADNLRALARAAAIYACEVTIHLATNLHTTLHAGRPLADEPLADDDAVPDEMWMPPGGLRPGTLIFDTERYAPAPSYSTPNPSTAPGLRPGLLAGLMQQATTDFAPPRPQTVDGGTFILGADEEPNP